MDRSSGSGKTKLFPYKYVAADITTLPKNPR